MNKFLLLFCLLLTGCISTLSPRYTRTPAQMKMINSAVVALVSSQYSVDGSWDTYCSGAFIGSDIILTAAHCVDDAGTDPVYVSMYTEDPGINYENVHYGFVVYRMDDDSDLALLRKQDDVNLPAHTWLTVGDTAPSQGENVILVGHPLGLSWTLTTGVVSSDSRHGWDDVDYELEGVTRPLYIQHDASAYPGSSGGPLLNYNNELVGVLVQGHRVAEFMAMSVHTDLINEFLSR